MITKLDQRQRAVAEAIQRIQKPAYKVEAQLIGFEGIPQIYESVEEIQESDEIFWGWNEQEIKGFIAFKEIEGIIDIHRLVVAPSSFRQGIGKKLLAYLLDQYEDCEFMVSTGSANVPAVKLYKSLGFIEQEHFEAAPGLKCIKFIKRK